MKIYKLISAAALALCASLTLTGCIGREPNEIAYVVALGIDGAENGNYKITIQYANPTKISGGEDGEQAGSNITENLAVEAPSVYSAIGLANQLDSKNFSLSHTKLIIFSRALAEKGLGDLTEMFARSEELRPDVYVAVALGEAEEYLESVKPAMEINPAKYYQLIFDKNKLVGLPEGTQQKFFFGIESGDYDSLLPAAGVVNAEEKESNSSDEEKEAPPKTNKKQNEAPLNEEPFEYKMRDYIAGQNAIAVENESETMGSAIFRGDTMVGILGSIETEIYKLLDKDYAYSYITLYSEKTPESPVTIKAIQTKEPKFRIDIENKTIDISLSLEGDIYSMPAGYDIENDLKGFEENAQRYIDDACGRFVKNIMEKYGSDIFRLNEKCKTKFLTVDAYNKYKENADYSDFDVTVSTQFKIRRTGLIIKG